MLSYSETNEVVRIILGESIDEVRSLIHRWLTVRGLDETELYAGLVEHAPGMNLTAEQWFDLLSKFPNRLLRSQLALDKILSESQIAKLPPVTG